jgi:hypothetical protein
MTVYYTLGGWSGTAIGVASPAKIMGVPKADVKKVIGDD